MVHLTVMEPSFSTSISKIPIRITLQKSISWLQEVDKLDSTLIFMPAVKYVLAYLALGEVKLWKTGMQKSQLFFKS